MIHIVLAGSHRETNQFAKAKGLGYGVRHIVNRDQLRAARPDAIHVLPSFSQRRDVHSFTAPLKRIERMYPHTSVIDYELVDGEYREVGAVLEPVEPPVNPRARRKRPTAAAKADVAKNAGVAIDTSAVAVPGQMSLEEAIVPESADRLSAMQELADSVEPDPAPEDDLDAFLSS